MSAPATRPAGHSWWAYLLPMFVFLGLGELSGRFPEAAAPVFFALKVLAPLGLFLHFLRRGHYPELRGYPLTPGGLAADVAVGVLGAAVWMAPAVLGTWSGAALWESLPAWLRPAPEDAFDPQMLGESLAWLALSLRAVGYGVVTPFVEELFVRSWLMRYADVFDRPVDFRDVPIGRYARRSFWVVVVFFTVSHVPWEWPVAVLWVVGTQLWFYHRKHLMALVVVHAASNLSIFLCALAAAGRLTDRTGAPLDLWFFL